MCFIDSIARLKLSFTMTPSQTPSDNTRLETDLATEKTNVVKKLSEQLVRSIMNERCFKEMQEANVGGPELEGFLRNFKVKLKSVDRLRDEGANRILRAVLSEQILDAQKWSDELSRRLSRAKNTLKVLVGHKSRRFQNVVKAMKKEKEALEKELKTKYKKKIEHYKKKYRKRKEK